MQITASMVKDLRERTGAGMMDAKNALQENGGNFDAAVDWLRKKGMAKAEKKADRVANQGLVVAFSEGTRGAIVEVNSETDFVAKNEQFVAFTSDLAKMVLATGTTDAEAVKESAWKEGGTVADKLTSLVATIGENITFRRAATLEVENGVVSSYVHMGGKIGVLVALEAEGADLSKIESVAKNVAMHVAAINPAFLDRASIDPEVLAKEREIYTERARESGKPEAIIEKIVEGQVNKYCEEVCLIDQAFVMDSDKKVGQVVQDAGAKLVGFVRFGLGEGIEKKEDDFAAEVAAAVAGA